MRIIVKILHIPIEMIQFFLILCLELVNLLEIELLKLIGESPIVDDQE
jgi:hypothetical protein